MPVQTTYPGVYIEEAPSGVHTIVGVSTSVTAFVGAAGRGPVDMPVRIFSFADYQRTFGPTLDEARPMGHAVAHFFANGGSQAIVVRAAGAGAAAAEVTLQDGPPSPIDVLTLTANGLGTWANRAGGIGMEVAVTHNNVANPDDLFALTITYWIVDPSTNQPVKGAEESFINLSMSASHPRYVLTALATSQLVAASLPTSAPTTGANGTSTSGSTASFPLTIASPQTLRVAADFGPALDVTIPAGTYAGTTAGIVKALNDALLNAGLAGVSAAIASGVITLTSSATTLDSSVVVTPGGSADISQALELGLAWGGKEVSGSAAFRPADSGATPFPFAGGGNGADIGPDDVVPATGSGGVYTLKELIFPRFNILCLPGLTSADDVQIGLALSYCVEERAFLVVDSPAAGFTAIPPNIGSLQALGDHGALYYPRIQVTEAVPGGSRTLNLPPCGAVAGVMARIDTARGIWKAPAGLEAGIVGITGLANPTGAPPVDDNLSGLLNPHGVNCLRTFPAGGTVVWGARTLRGDDTLSSDFKYIPVRRVTDYIASSLYLGTQFAVFEPNDPTLWGQLRLAVGSFMRGLFRQGAFQQSEKRAESDSFFVICDDTVNPQSEIDAGRVNVVVGFAPLKPAEFVVITITQISQLEG